MQCCSKRDIREIREILLGFTYSINFIGVPNGIRTRVAALKGPCPRPLDDGDLSDLPYKGRFFKIALSILHQNLDTS